ncbi:uncharacterized protein LOC135819604 [Sycon ciliatum]|uniref:uncharacterized protein LOC135819604 n=1 Tax=Sycon ciliatum TaxID=27933 RepID=UPI0031F66830
MKFILAILICVAVCQARPQNDDHRHHDHTEYNKSAPCVGKCSEPGPVTFHMAQVKKLKEKAYAECHAEGKCPLNEPSIRQRSPCVDGKSAGQYECSNVDMMSYVSLRDMGSSGDGNDIWGWTDEPEPGVRFEYAIVGTHDGTSFVDVTNAEDPTVLGFLPTHTRNSMWRDVKVYENHAFIVSEASDHGMQVFNLLRLRQRPPAGTVPRLKADAHYGKVGNAHNIVINEETGYAYIVGSEQYWHLEYIPCAGGLHIVDIREPLSPRFLACYGRDYYTHDAQCVIYHGPDVRYYGNEICFAYNENTLTIIDVTNKKNMVMLSRTKYKNVAYTHQGWLTEDHAYLISNDELDEKYGKVQHTRSLLWDVKNLQAPVHYSSFMSTEKAIDHNLYIRGNLAYETNYCAGLRILDITDMAEGAEQVREVAYFDVAPDWDSVSFHGSWSSYPFFESGNVIVSSIERGLFVLRPNHEAIKRLQEEAKLKRKAISH